MKHIIKNIIQGFWDQFADLKAKVYRWIKKTYINFIKNLMLKDNYYLN